MTGYLYDADGTRVAKGTITAWSCDPALSGFKTTNDYVLGPSGEQASEMGVGDTEAGSSSATALVWQHTNVWADGQLLDPQRPGFYSWWNGLERGLACR
jgi:hypothetical protein